METTLVQTANQAIKEAHIGVFRWQKWVDGDGKLWIVTCLFGGTGNRYSTNVELLDVDNERTIDVARTEFDGWVKTGSLKRVETPILL